MTVIPTRTSWWWTQTHIADDADARGADMSIASIMSPRNIFHSYIAHQNDPHAKPDFMVRTSRTHMAVIADARGADMSMAYCLIPPSHACSMQTDTIFTYA